MRQLTATNKPKLLATARANEAKENAKTHPVGEQMKIAAVRVGIEPRANHRVPIYILLYGANDMGLDLVYMVEGLDHGYLHRVDNRGLDTIKYYAFRSQTRPPTDGFHPRLFGKRSRPEARLNVSSVVVRRNRCVFHPCPARVLSSLTT